MIGKNRLGIQLYTPTGVVFDNDQNMFVADYSNHRIVEWKFNSTNRQVVFGEDQNLLKYPVDMIIDKEDNSVIIADQGNRRVIRWRREIRGDPDILISDIDCFGITMDKTGNLYVADYKKNVVKRWKKGSNEGTIVVGGNGKGEKCNQLNSPRGLSFDEHGNLYVIDHGNDRIQKFEIN